MIDSVISIVSGGLSGAIVVFLLRTWLKTRIESDIRFIYDEKLEHLKAELSAETEKRMISHQNEFDLYQKIWTPLARVRLACDHLPEKVFIDDSDDNRDKVFKRCIENMSPLIEAIEYNKPFLPAGLCGALEEFYHTCLSKMLAWRYTSIAVLTPEEIKQSYEDLGSWSDRIAAEIRKRIRTDVP